MKVLQFAFGELDSEHLPHHHVSNSVVYTGTHDNDTTVGWWNSGTGKTTRRREEVERERAFCLRYLGSDGSSIHWDLIRCAMASPADTAIFPLQDVLGLGTEARMNLPGRPEGNWRWRYVDGALTAEVRERLRMLTQTYGRATQAAGGGPPRAQEH
jgi:4-alpha-glucanotransferase